MYNIKTLRGTIFCSPIRYSKEFLNALQGTVDGYMLMQIRDNNVLPVLPTWQLTSPDEKEILAFNGEKIDIVHIVEGEVTEEKISDFAARCKTVFAKIMDVTGYVCTRIALAPSIIISEKSVKPKSLYDKIFSIREFQGEALDTSNISQVFRVNKPIGGKEIKVNHVSNFNTESELVNIGGVNQIRERYIGSFDINTMVNPEYKFSLADVTEFFDFAPSCFVDFYKLYFSE